LKSRDFCYWLQGAFEITGVGADGLTPVQVQVIKNHLALVFKHEIDPSMGSPAHQAELDELHGMTDKPVAFRC